MDEEEYIDHAGLVIMRHMIGEVSFFCLLSWGIEEKNRMLGANVRRKCSAQLTVCSAQKQNVRRSEEMCWAQQMLGVNVRRKPF